MIIATGGVGFIGSNIVRPPNDKDITDILMVDSLKDDTEFVNLVGLNIADYMDKKDFLTRIMTGEDFSDIEATFHEDAYSSTTERDGKYITDNSYQYSKELLHYCPEREIPFLYASPAVTYGGRISDFIEPHEYEKPLNVYGYSKFLFDEYVRQILPETNPQIVDFRYFNVYGPCEGHKGSMASATFHLNTQFNNDEMPKLSEGSGNFKHDFVYIGDMTMVNLWPLENRVSGIFNLDTGRAEFFQAVVDTTLVYYKRGSIEYIPFPEELKDRYQAFTQAGLANLRTTGYDKSLKTIAEGVTEYMAWLSRDA